MPAPRNVNTRMTDSGGGGNNPRSPYAPNYINNNYQQQAAERARLIAEAQARAQQQAAAQAAQLAAQQRAAQLQAQQAAQRAAQLAAQQQQTLAQKAYWNSMNMEPNAPTWRSPIAQQPAPSLQNTLSMERTAPAWQPNSPTTVPTLQQTLSMEPVAPPITYQYHSPFTDAGNAGTTRTPWNFSIRRTGQFVSPTTAPTTGTPFDYSTSYFSNYWTNMMNRRDAYGNLVPTGPINEYWEFTDVPDSGGGGWGGGWGGGGGYEQEASAPFYRGEYTQNRSRWNETLLTWGLRQE